MDAFFAHAVIDPRAAAGADRPEARAAKAMGVQVLGPVAERPFARVWRARTQDARQVGLVVIDDAATDADRERFAQASERLCSAGAVPGTVRVHAVAPSRDAFIADLCTMGCATDLPALHWSPHRRLEFVRRVAEALEALHRTGIVHGCLCADNVLLDDDLQPVLAEVGLVSVHTLLARRADCANYAAFAAPEVKRGEEPDVRSDVWSAGHLLEQLVGEGEVPQTGDVVRRCVALLPHMRYPSAQELVEAIDAIIAALPTGDRAAREAVAAPPASGHERQAAVIEPVRPRTPNLAIERALRWLPAVGAASLATAVASAFLLGPRAATLRGLLVGMFVGGAALATWVVPSFPRARVGARIVLALSCAALAIVLDPLSSVLRAGAQWRLHGDNAARREAVVEMVELGRDFRGMSLAGLDLSSLDLAGADFRRADLSRADLSGSRLWAAEIEGATLRETKLSHTNLEETALGEAIDVESAECDAATRLPRGWRCVLGKPLSH
jgi:hypothetical protein